MEHKALGAPIEFKLSDTPGAFRAVFSLFNAVDLDKDVTLPGAFTDGQEVRIAQWAHNWAMPPIGKGVINSDAERAWVDGEFFLATQAGKETYEVVKSLGSLGQWSYGFDVQQSSRGDFQGEPVRYLERLNVHEVSPVMLGAQPRTYTDTIKSAESKQAIPGSFEDRQEMVARAVMARYGSQGGIGTDQYAYPVATFSDRVVVCIYGGDAEDYREVDYTIDGDTVTLGNERPVDLQTTIVPKGLDFPDHSERVRIAVIGYVGRLVAGSAIRAKEGRAISESRRGRMATVRDQLRVGADEIDGLLSETEPKPKEVDPAIRAEFLRYQRLRARQFVGA